MEALDLPETALNDLIGIPFEKDATGPEAYGCYGLCQEIQRWRGFFLPDHPTIESMEMRKAMLNRQPHRYCEPIERPEAYCLILFDMRTAGLHLGMVLPDTRYFIHSSQHRGRVRIEKLIGSLWERFLYGFYHCTCQCD